ncbi:MAG: hypothetical protein IJ418_17275 [Clostridia bacterium]|nr:hypothetical protein [Clostridia bacterium]
MFFDYEGVIRLQIPKKMCAPLHLLSLNTADARILPQICETCKRAHLSIRLSATVCDAAGYHHPCDAELLLPCSKEAVSTAHICVHASIRLLHSHQAGPDTFFICARIQLTQIYACTSACESQQTCHQGLPLYPHLSVKRFGKSGEKHNLDVIL